MSAPLRREELTQAIISALEPLPWVQALAEAGSHAFGRADAWSDVDLLLVVDNGRHEEALRVVEQALAACSPIEAVLRIPEPAWHGMSQAFYRLERAGPHLLVDLCVASPERPNSLSEVERHGTPTVYFDKTGAVQVTALDRPRHRALLERRIATLRVSFPMFQTLVTRAVARGQALDAIGAYHAHTLRPLVELLRIRHDPARHDYHLRYLSFDLPPEVHAALVDLAYPASPQDILQRQRVAAALFADTLAHLDREGVTLLD